MLAPIPRPSRPIDLIVIHCSATPSGQPLRGGGKKDSLNAAQVIDAWHATRGFARPRLSVLTYNPGLPSIGYHYVIDLDGTVLTGRGLEEVGAHAQGYNQHSVGICLVGGAEKVGRYTPAQWASLKELAQQLCMVLSVPCATARPAPAPGAPQPVWANGLCGHRDLSPDTNGNGQADPAEWLKTCPGFSVRQWLASGMQALPDNTYTGV